LQARLWPGRQAYRGARQYLGCPAGPDLRILGPPLQRWWCQLCAGTRARRWSIVFAAAALIGLLFAFHNVVRGAVTQGEQRRAAVAARELALWRCSTQGSAPLRSSCRAVLDGPPPVTLAGTSGR
jgi:hypothetical protein